MLSVVEVAEFVLTFMAMNIIPRSLLPKSNLNGRHLHTLFLELVNSVDPELAISVHGQSVGLFERLGALSTL
jgi:hypothetical protein